MKRKPPGVWRFHNLHCIYCWRSATPVHAVKQSGKTAVLVSALEQKSSQVVFKLVQSLATIRFTRQAYSQFPAYIEWLFVLCGLTVQIQRLVHNYTARSEHKIPWCILILWTFRWPRKGDASLRRPFEIHGSRWQSSCLFTGFGHCSITDQANQRRKSNGGSSLCKSWLFSCAGVSRGKEFRYYKHFWFTGNKAEKERFLYNFGSLSFGPLHTPKLGKNGPSIPCGGCFFLQIRCGATTSTRSADVAKQVVCILPAHSRKCSSGGRCCGPIRQFNGELLQNKAWFAKRTSYRMHIIFSALFSAAFTSGLLKVSSLL